ncbi:MAG: hypothetical protein BWY05_00650 [Euryarchaeota archaeon ADurb.Bin165]|jgi:hypothetical protein|nr:MAG: hypothetical protein BWY05_00650 [Euryarchaeota archaeon ADurb.Bin165]
MIMKLFHIFSVLIVMSICIIMPASAAWSIPHMPPSTKNWNGYWQFEYDPENPVSAAMYCCWWEMVHGHLSKYSDALSGKDIELTGSPAWESASTKSYCPACYVDDSFATLEVDPELMAIHDELMQTKPWLKEGKEKKSDSQTQSGNSSAGVMFFSEPKKI